MYADDLISGGNTVEEVREIKEKSIQLFKKGGFNLLERNSNKAKLQSENTQNSEPTYTKQTLLQNKKNRRSRFV